MTWGLHEGVHVGDAAPWMCDRERADAERIERAFAKLTATVNPDDPWAHPDARRLDRMSLGSWLRESTRCPPCAVATSWPRCRCPATGQTGPRCSPRLRKHASLGGEGLYDLEQWEGLRVAEGRRRWHCGWPPSWVRGSGSARWSGESRWGRAASRVELDDGEVIGAEAVICTIPAGPLREVEITGLSEARLRSLRRIAMRWRRRWSWPTRFLLAGDGPERARRNRVAVRLVLAAGHRRCCRCWCRQSASPHSAAPPDARSRDAARRSGGALR